MYYGVETWECDLFSMFYIIFANGVYWLSGQSVSSVFQNGSFVKIASYFDDKLNELDIMKFAEVLASLRHEILLCFIFCW